MRELFETDEGKDEEGLGAASDPPTIPGYDPLFDPWDESSHDDALTFSSEDSLAWDVPASEPFPGPGYQSAYPDRYQPPYGERLTELQRRLRAGTITIPRPERRWLVTARELVETLLLAALIFLAVRASFQNFRVEGASMSPSLQHGEYLIVNKLTYAELDVSIFDWLPFVDSGDNPLRHLWDSPSRGDVIVFKAPTSPDRDFIKRIIGLPGDTVSIDPSSGQVRVNGSLLTEPYIAGTTNCNQECEREIPEANSEESFSECGSAACYFVMGDNRQNSSDSRQGWLVPEENIVGKALITYWHDGSPDLDLAPNHSVGLSDAAAAEE